MKYIIGIDEAGRGSLAGPITLAAFVAYRDLKTKLIEILGGKIKDSKQFSPTRRCAIYRRFLKLRKTKKVFFTVSHISNKLVDERGITDVARLGIEKCLRKLKIKNLSKVENYKSKILLDGSLKAPEKYRNQKTIIGGDGKNIFIACASIVAKVRRDCLMCQLAKKYPAYKFEIHKGYGTSLHCRLIKKNNFSEIHRKSFCKNLPIWEK